MGIEYMELGSTPYDEDCAQVGSVEYNKYARKEMEIYINQLDRMFPDAESKGIDFKIKWFNHDFGRYGEVCAYWNTDDEIADEYVYIIESDLPSNWDEQAKQELSELYV
jgi:hypothetical protein